MPQNEGAISFDASAGDGAWVALACSIAFTLVRATLRDMAKRDLLAALDKVEARLAQATGRAELVAAIRQRVQDILQAI